MVNNHYINYDCSYENSVSDKYVVITMMVMIVIPIMMVKIIVIVMIIITIRVMLRALTNNLF